MKKMIVLSCTLLALASCMNKSKEVKIDETKVEKPLDSLVEKDTVTVLETKNPDMMETSTTSKSIKVNGEKGVAVKVSYASFGKKIAADKALSKEQMMQKYASLKKGDTIEVKFKSNVSAVCKKKGCWMKMDLSDNKESFVRFKDYGFFVPLNADNSEAIVSGKAYIDEISVAEQKHYAKDGGKSQQEIDKITVPKVTYAFQADGVLIQQ